ELVPATSASVLPGWTRCRRLLGRWLGRRCGLGVRRVLSMLRPFVALGRGRAVIDPLDEGEHLGPPEGGWVGMVDEGEVGRRLLGLAQGLIELAPLGAGRQVVGRERQGAAVIGQGGGLVAEGRFRLAAG